MQGEEEERQTAREELQHLKRVSRIKHMILQRYLPPWARILGSRYRSLRYFDCFAGPGEYEMEGRPVAGSPVIAVEGAIEFLRGGGGQRLDMYLVEDNPEQVGQLQASLESLRPFPQGLGIHVRRADSRSHVPSLLQDLGTAAPAFFFIDPYGHPLPLPVINNILNREHTETLINLMWFRINMDLSNPSMQSRVDQLFGDKGWQEQTFLNMRGIARERSFLEYFRSRLACKFLLPFRIRFDVEDSHGGSRTKYYLLHASNHVKAVLLMKEVMWPLGDEEGTFDYSGESQGVLISSTPTTQELERILLHEFNGQNVSFDALRELTWELPFIAKHYREVLKDLEKRNAVAIRRVTSKRTGIQGQDRILFK